MLTVKIKPSTVSANWVVSAVTRLAFGSAFGIAQVNPWPLPPWVGV